MISTELARYIKEQRLKKSWTQAQLAIIAGLSERTIQRIERNGSGSAETLLALASAFEINVENLTSLISVSQKKGQRHLIPISALRKGWIGFLIMIPALYFATSNILYYNLGVSSIENFLIPLNNGTQFSTIFNLLSPFIFLGGLSIALYFNLDALFLITFNWQRGKIHSAILFKPILLNLSVALLSGLTIFVFIAYAFVENFVVR